MEERQQPLGGQLACQPGHAGHPRPARSPEYYHQCYLQAITHELIADALSTMMAHAGALLSALLVTRRKQVRSRRGRAKAFALHFSDEYTDFVYARTGSSDVSYSIPPKCRREFEMGNIRTPDSASPRSYFPERILIDVPDPSAAPAAECGASSQVEMAMLGCVDD